MNEQIEPTLQDQLLKILFADGLGEGLANIAQLLITPPCSSSVKITSVPTLTNAASSATAMPIKVVGCRISTFRSCLIGHYRVHSP